MNNGFEKKINLTLLIFFIAFFLLQIVIQFCGGEDNLVYSDDAFLFNEGWYNTETGQQFKIPSNGVEHNSEYFYFSNTLPEHLENGYFLQMYSAHQEVQIEIDGKIRYEYTLKNLKLPSVTTPNKNNFVMLTKEDQGKNITIRTTSKVPKYISQVENIRIGHKDAIMKMLLVENIFSIFIGLTLILLGILFLSMAIVINFIMKHYNSGLFYLAAFVFCVGMWLISESKMKDFIFPSLSFNYLTVHFCLRWASIYFLMFFNELQEKRHQKIYYLMAMVGLVIYIVDTILQLTCRVDYIQTLPITHIFMFMVVVVVSTMLFLDIINKKATKWGKFVLAGMLGFSFLIITEILLHWINTVSIRGLFTTIAMIFYALVLAWACVNDLMTKINSVQKEIIDSHIAQKKLILQNQQIQERIIIGLASIIDQRDELTGNHIENTKIYVEKIGTLMIEEGIYAEQLTKPLLDQFVRCAPLHDVGKITIPDSILKKPGPLTEEEAAIMRTHSKNGATILREFNQDLNNDDLEIACNMACYHHERWNGLGYPEGLKEEEIPLCARIMAVADIYDALRSPRVYKPAFDFDTSIRIMEDECGKRFDPKILELFLKHKEEFR